jgi:uncharacterized membrane protein
MLEQNINFFRPWSGHSRAGMKMILSIVIIWALAVFGFQFLLMVTNRPTPEPPYLVFEAAWPEISTRPAEVSQETKQNFARSLLRILGKNLAVKEEHKKVLGQSLSWITGEILGGEEKNAFRKQPDAEVAAKAIGLSEEGFDKLMREYLPVSLVPVGPEGMDPQSREKLPEIARLYLVHNQNFFTKARFMGFPFHYWYTAQFLLILFVCLCFAYAKLTDKINTKHNFIERD